MQGNQALASSQASTQGKAFTTLLELLPPATTIPVIESANEAVVDNLLSHLPPQLLLLSQEIEDSSSVDPSSETAKAAMEALSISQKRDILRKVLRSPQFTQSLGSLTHALRDGGLPSISEALDIPVENGGFLKRGGVPVGTYFRPLIASSVVFLELQDMFLCLAAQRLPENGITDTKIINRWRRSSRGICKGRQGRGG